MKHHIKLKRAMAIVTAAFLIFTVPVIAAQLVHGYEVNEITTNCDGIDPALCPTQHENENWPIAIVGNVVSWLMYIAGAASVVLIIVGGLRYILAAGNEQQVAGAKKMIIGALIGLGVVILNVAIIQLVKSALGVS